MRVLLTGASGFVGSHVLRHLLVHTDWEIVCPTTFHHKGLPARLMSAICDQPWHDRVTVIHWDMRSHADLLTRRSIGEIDAFLNVASESHVDRSIEEPVSFIENNVQLMLRALELARTLKPAIFLQMSTDEVYGPARLNQDHKEWEPVLPSNPYSASKAAQEAIAISYWRTYGVPVVITNTMNIVGEMQDPEKFVPKIIRNLREGVATKVHCSADGTPGSRMYLHARNLADAWLWLIRFFTTEITAGTYADHRLTLATGEVPSFRGGWDRPARLNIVGDQEINNVEMVHLIGNMMGLDHYTVDELIEPVDFHGVRPGHDLRYALDGEKIQGWGWTAPVDIFTSLKRTVDWTLEHPEWLEV